MRKKHKKALGLIGLAAVVGMTTVAANLPTPAGAVASVTDVISVTVIDGTTPTVTIKNLTEGAVLTSPNLELVISHTNLKNLTIRLKRSDSATSTEFTHSFDFDDRNGDYSLPLNLNDYGGYGSYSIYVEGDGYNGGLAAGNSVSFRYSSVSIDGIGSETDTDGNITGSNIATNPENGNPVITPETTPEVKDVLIQVFPKGGNEPVITTTGKNQEPIELPFLFEGKGLLTGDYIIVITGRDANQNPVGDPIKILYHYVAPQSGEVGKDPVIDLPEVSGGHYVLIEVLNSDSDSVIPEEIRSDVGGDVTLPFTKYNLPAGTYTIVVTEYDARGNIIKTYEIVYYYVPSVPKTGNLLSKLNISRADYLTTGAVVFGVALIFAFILLRKKKGTRRR